MPDELLNEALRRFAAEAATRLSTLVASGDQIPFDLTRQSGPEALFHSYLPLTDRYVREREAELRSLPSFEHAVRCVAAGGVAARYLEARGETVRAAPHECAAHMLTVFIASLWDGCTEFSLDHERLEQALTVLEAQTRDPNEAELVIVPIIGLQMALPRLSLPRGVELLRAESIDAPPEAVHGDGLRRAAWEPQFLAVAEQGDEDDSCEAALRQLRELITVMRLFKTGGVGLGPHAFVPTGEGQWRRLPTGAAAPRHGGYRLSGEEAAELAELAVALESRSDPSGSLAWAIHRFELGCERPTPGDGLSDQLLALRAALEGHGPVGATLAMRSAALVAADADARESARERIEAALEAERAVMAGDPPPEVDELAGWVEQSVREILREAALGEHGSDLGAAAEETLIATGLEAGDAEIAVTVYEQPTEQWELPQEEDDDMEETRILEPIPAEDEIKITAANWLDEVASGEQELEWPAGEGEVGRRARIDSPRVRHLFPVPDDADWEVRELDYDHYRETRRAG